MSLATLNSPANSSTHSSALRAGPVERPYLTRVLGILQNPSERDAIEAHIGSASRQFVQEQGHRLRPSWWRGGLTLLKTVAGVVLPLWAAWSVATAGTWWPVPALVMVAGVALYGGTSIVHDTVHGSFLPNKRANRVLGKLLAPLFLLDYATFQRSHMGHHRFSQSVGHDPKYPKLPWANPSLDVADPSRRRGNGLTRALTGLWIRLASRVLEGPAPVRAAFYVTSILVFGAPAVLLFGGEVSLLQRNWRAPGPWFSLARGVTLYASLYTISPLLGALAVATLWWAMSCFFMIFLTHLSPYQLYHDEARSRAPKLLALNVSDIRVGPLTRAFGNLFSEYHATHHLFPAIPSYRLAHAGHWVDDTFGPFKAPALHPLSVADASLIGDGVVATVTRPPQEALPILHTPSGTFMRRTAARLPERGAVVVVRPVPSPERGSWGRAA